MAARIWRWWTDGLSSPWPASVRKWFGKQKTRLWISPADSGYHFLTRKGSSWKTVAEAGGETGLNRRTRKRLNSSWLVLLVPDEQALVRTFNAPHNVEARHHIESRLAEVSPLPASQQYYDYAADGDGLTLAITRKTWVDSTLEELGALGIGVDQVTVKNLENKPINLLPGSSGEGTTVDIPGVVLLTAGLLLCIAGFHLATQQQHDTLAAIETRQQELQEILASGQPVRDRIDLLQTQVSVMGQRQSGSASPLSLLTDVTRATPDHTWVRNWILDGSELTLLGETTDTADLISALEASPLLSKVHYESAITRDPANNRERFRISAGVESR